MKIYFVKFLCMVNIGKKRWIKIKLLVIKKMEKVKIYKKFIKQFIILNLSCINLFFGGIVFFFGYFDKLNKN